MSHKVKRTDCAETGVSSSGSISSPSESSSRTGRPRRRKMPGSLGVFSGQGTPSRSCAITAAMSFTPSLVRMPLPALRMTSEQPRACACNVVQVDSESSSHFGKDIMAPTVFFKNSVTSSRTTLGSMSPLCAASCAHPAITSQVVNIFSRRPSESCMSMSDSKFWHVAGRNGQKSPSKAFTKVSINSRASSISSRTDVFKPSNCRFSSKLSASSSSSGFSAGRCFKMLKMLGRSISTYGLKSLPKVDAIFPAASWKDSRLGSSAAKPSFANGIMTLMIS
mmetsp:Transcript_29413/g.73872  ORF Transcript_29413/g.73872 Transcript_29413/m.73872 type:complete len:279 (+) Transcript_29413:838-1674(+)